MAAPIRKSFGSISWSILKTTRLLPTVTAHHQKCLCSQAENNVGTFDERMLDFLVCPLTKLPLRYDKANNELISNTAGVAYPVINGVPNLVPQDGRMLDKKPDNQT